MAITITDAALSAALRVGDTTLESTEVARIRGYAVEHITRYMGTSFDDTPDNVLNEAVVRLCAYLYDAGPSAPNAVAVSGAGSVLFPWRAIAATSTGEAAAQPVTPQTPIGSVDNPVTDVLVGDGTLTVVFADGTTRVNDIATGSGFIRWGT